uniref:Uncharacterized protein n=1 Tax=Meloidogyne floridensis TaxID=298350 RepID=A0A915NL09_9BILA
MGLSFALFSLHAYYPSLLLTLLIISTVLLVKCAKKKKATQANAMTVKAKRPPPRIQEEKPRKEGVAAVKDYQTLGNLDANIFLKEQKKKGGGKTPEAKDKTAVEKTKEGADKKDDSKDKKDPKADKTEAAGKDGGDKQPEKTAMVKTQTPPVAADKKEAA